MADAQQVFPTDDSYATSTDPTGVTGGTSLEDERGVDLADLRARLRLSPAERAPRLVDHPAGGPSGTGLGIDHLAVCTCDPSFDRQRPGRASTEQRLHQAGELLGVGLSEGGLGNVSHRRRQGCNSGGNLRRDLVVHTVTVVALVRGEVADQQAPPAADRPVGPAEKGYVVSAAHETSPGSQP